VFSANNRRNPVQTYQLEKESLRKIDLQADVLELERAKAVVVLQLVSHHYFQYRALVRQSSTR
jgi:hypothetical protein